MLRISRCGRAVGAVLAGLLCALLSVSYAKAQERTQTGVFVVTGTIYRDSSPAEEELNVVVRNLTTGSELSDITGQTANVGGYVVTFSDLSGNRAAAIGDEMEVTVYDGEGSVLGQASRIVTADEIAASLARIDVNLTEVEDLDITTTSLSGGVVGVAYSQTLSTTGGVTPYRWAITLGRLPGGLSLNSSTGVISGTPTTMGTRTFIVRVTDSATPANTDAQQLSIIIEQPQLVSIIINAERVKIYRLTNRANVVVGRTERFSAVGLDNAGNEVSITPTWRVTGRIGTVDPNTGEFTAAEKARLRGEIIASAEGVEASLRITTTPGRLSAITVLPEDVTIKLGQTVSFSARGTDRFGNDVGRIRPLWFVVPKELGEITLITGQFTARQVGSGYIEAFARFKLGYTGMHISPKLLAGQPSGRAHITIINDLPDDFLFRSYPNPFNAETTIQYDLPGPGVVHLSIYNLSGQLIRILVEGERPAGRHSVMWDGRDDAGRDVASGIYLCRIKAGDYTAMRKMVLVR